MGAEEARSNHGLGYVDALDGPLSDGGSIPPASILQPVDLPPGSDTLVFSAGRGVTALRRRVGRRDGCDRARSA